MGTADPKYELILQEITSNAKAVQENVLAEILTQNAHTQYLMPFNLQQDNISEAFKSKVPIVSYEDIQPLIRRMADGDTSPLLSAHHPIPQFLYSSGTSAGEPKLLPTCKEDDNRRILYFRLIQAVLSRSSLLNDINVEKSGVKGLNFLYTRKETKTKGGILAITALTSWYKTDSFKKRLSNEFTSPTEAVYCTDTYQSTYAQMLCGLYDRDQVVRIGAAFASGLLRAIRFLHLNWPQLAHDIRTASLNSKLTDTLLRERMATVMRPDPVLADFIAHECANDDWAGIIPRIWPHARYLDVVITGTMSQYIPALDYYSGGLPIVSMVYASSESFFGINLNPMCNPLHVSYTILPNMAFFEFLPHEPAELTHKHLVDLVNVEIGKEYEIVVTTYAGLYRYRVGDILRVTGFHNSVPQFQFVRRKNVLLSVDSDKTDEAELQAAVDKTTKLLREFNTSVVDYTSYVDSTTIPGHYVIYLELLVNDSDLNSPSDKQVMEQCCLEIEESLSSVYRHLRFDGSIGSLEIRIVKNGSFEELADFAISRGASLGQYKVPRCIGDNQIIPLLNSRVVSTHFSPSLPQWKLGDSL